MSTTEEAEAELKEYVDRFALAFISGLRKQGITETPLVTRAFGRMIGRISATIAINEIGFGGTPTPEEIRDLAKNDRLPGDRISRNPLVKENQR